MSSAKMQAAASLPALWRDKAHQLQDEWGKQRPQMVSLVCDAIEACAQDLEQVGLQAGIELNTDDIANRAHVVIVTSRGKGPANHHFVREFEGGADPGNEAHLFAMRSMSNGAKRAIVAMRVRTIEGPSPTRGEEQP